MRRRRIGQVAVRGLTVQVGRMARLFGSAMAVLVLVSVASFWLTNLLPGDPATSLLPPGSPPEATAQLRAELRLDDPVPARFIHWAARVAQGDLGTSYRTGEPVIDVLRRALLVTGELVVLVQLFALALGVAVGVASARYAGGWFDRLAQAAAFGAMAVPGFVVALVFLLVFAVRLHWFPAVGFVHLTDDPIENLRSMVMPTVTLGLSLAARYARLVRAEMIATLQGNHILLARAMGIPERRIHVRHALRQSSFSLLTVFGLECGLLLGGAVVVERVFAVPGLGMLIVESVSRREYLIIQGAVLLVGTVFVVAGLATDVAHSLLDPRIRVRGAAT